MHHLFAFLIFEGTLLFQEQAYKIKESSCKIQQNSISRPIFHLLSEESHIRAPFDWFWFLVLKNSVFGICLLASRKLEEDANVRFK